LITEDELPHIRKMAAKHDVAQLVALGLKNNGLLHAGNEAEIKQDIFRSALRYERIAYEFQRICATLSCEGISFIPLKGSVIRAYYPEPWMRMSCDIDVLVHEEDLKRAIEVLVRTLGYRADERVGYHDVSLYSKSGVHLELHFHIRENMEKVDGLLADVWQYAVRDTAADGYRYALTPEFFIFHHVAHMSYHFVHGGCGIKPFVDLLVIRNKLAYDDGLLRDLLRRCGMETFYEHILHVTNVWFGDEKHDPLSMQIEDYVVKGGVYGSLENRIAVEQGKRGGKLRYVLSRIFLPYESLRQYYPILKTRKWLYPVMLVRRWFRFLFSRRWKHGMREIQVNQSVSKSQADYTKEFIRHIGL
jgi:hypothetical protein